MARLDIGYARRPMRLLPTILLPLLLSSPACNGDETDDDSCECEECTECTECPTDADGDGFTEEQGDCNDHDPDVHPLAEEACGDEVDSDCDGDPDDGQADLDADGYVDQACTDGTDCDDADPERHPDVIDGCDGMDNDCDEEIDEDTVVVDASGGGEYNTIGEGVDAAASDGVVCVRAGTYYEDVLLEGKDLTLQSMEGSAATLIEGTGLRSTVSHTLGDGSTVIGFTIAGGIGTEFDPDHDGVTDHCGGGVFVDASAATYSDVVITDNTASDGAGIYVNSGSLTMDASVITANQATRYGGALRVRDSDSVLLTSCDLSDNVAGYGGAMALYRAEPTLLNCIIEDNQATDKGGAMYVGSESVISLSSCTISGNTSATIGGAIRLYNSQAVIGGCQITHNTAVEQGGGIDCKRSTTSMTMTDVVDNEPDNVVCDDCQGCTES